MITCTKTIDSIVLINDSRLVETSSTLRALSALSQPTRLAIYRLLARTGTPGLRTIDMAAHLDAPANTISTHIMILSAAKLIEARREGKNVHYSANKEIVRQLAKELVDPAEPD